MEVTTAAGAQQWGPQYYEPAGLEVAPHSYHPASEEKVFYERSPPSMPADATTTRYEELESVPQSTSRFFPRSQRQRIIWLVVGLGLVAIIIGAAVGGTLASRKSGSSSSASSTSSPSPSPSSVPTTTPPKSIKQNSPLAVSAYRKINGIEIYLFFKGPDNAVYRSVYDSASGLPTSNSSLWQSPMAITIRPGATSPICATTIVWDQHFNPQVGLYHFSAPNNLLTGTNINTQLQPNFQDDGIMTYNLTYASPSTRISCYWPYIVFQDSSNTFTEMRNDLDGFGKGTFSPSGGYSARSIGQTGTNGSRVAVVPLSSLMSTSASKGGYGVIYQQPGGTMAAFIPDEAQTKNVSRSWSAGANFPPINLPDPTTFAAFATARADDSKNRTNTYVLYQFANGTIGMAWRDDEAAWKTSHPAALAVADAGTEIACLTMPESTRDATGSVVLLEGPSTAVSRCYFQRGGAVVEVQLEGTDWVELGVVPLP